MKASETKLQEIIEGTKQYIIPMFQRTYSWQQKHWSTLWEDIIELLEDDDYESHFIGSIVSIPVNANPHGVQQFLVIDGQQRLTTLLLLLSALRDTLKNTELHNLSEEIHDTMLVNRYKKGEEYFKLLPTQVDREVFKKVINQEEVKTNDSLIVKAYQFFIKKIEDSPINMELLKTKISNNLSIVSIVLSANDNPYLVFESLNAKGEALTEADLIRNYLFMRIHPDEQEEMYVRYWLPMQESLKGHLTEFIRHFLLGINLNVKKKDVYFKLKQQADSEAASEYLKKLSRFSKYYSKLLTPNKEGSLEIRHYLQRIATFEARTAYPFLLYVYQDYQDNKYTAQQFKEILAIIDNYLVRRFVCSIESKPLNKMFASLYNQISPYNAEESITELKAFLQVRGYPKDEEVRNNLLNFELYGQGDRREKCKFILSIIENSYGHKERVDLSTVTIEHILPQTLTEWWIKELGKDAEEIHTDVLHTIGNLTLTGYNAELSNESFLVKKKYYEKSNLQLNKDIVQYKSWTLMDIQNRTKKLTEDFLKIWSYFATETPITDDVTGSSPRLLTIMDKQYRVKTWRDVMEQTILFIYVESPNAYTTLLNEHPGFLAKSKEKMRSPKQLTNGDFIELNFSAKAIYKFCKRIIQEGGFDVDKWNVETEVKN